MTESKLQIVPGAALGPLFRLFMQVFLILLVCFPLINYARADNRCMREHLFRYAEQPLEYRASISGFQVSLTRSFQPIDEMSWQVQQQASALIAAITETSQFRLTGDNLVSEYYRYEQTGLGKRLIEINVGQNLVQVERDGKASEYTVDGLMSDNLSHLIGLQLYAACRDSSGSGIYDANIAQRKGQRPYRYEYQGIESVRLESGLMTDAEVWVRSKGEDEENRIWLAPEMDYRMVRFKHREGKESTELLLRPN